MRAGLLAGLAASGIAIYLGAADPPTALEDRLARHRNLGKAFYENTTTQKESVAEFRKALDLAPNSTREQLNLALAMLRAGQTAEALAKLLEVQKADPKIPHTWFNLGIAYKKDGETEKAIAQLEQMSKLVPDEPITRYNLGALYKLVGRNEDAIREFQLASKLDHTLAAPHFQLYNLYRTSSRPEEAKAELQVFQALKKGQEGAAIPEDVEWSAYSEIYEIVDDRPTSIPAAKLRFIALGMSKIPEGIEGDFDNDGDQDVLTLTSSGPMLGTQKLPAGDYASALWVDYDHDYDLDLILLGANSVLLRNQGAAGFVDRTADFPFVKGTALSAVATRYIADTKSFDVVISYSDRPAVLYRDLLQGKYEAHTLDVVPAQARRIQAADIDNNGALDLAWTTAEGVFVSLNRDPAQKLSDGDVAYAFADLENRGLLDLVTPGESRRNLGNGSFSEPTPISGFPKTCTSIEASDFDADGRIDLACGSKRYANRSVLTARWIGVKLTGVRNLKLAQGAEVEVKAGSRYQKKQYQGHPLVFGLGRAAVADTVRITWPNGLIQNEIRQAAGKRYSYQEAQRLSGSCPIIWTWNGTRFEYITDVLGVAPLGASSGDGEYFATDHDEYVQISGESLKPVGGEYEIRITEELSEVAYIDQVDLIAVDHPAATSVLTNEKFQGPPFPEFRLFGVERPIRPIKATDDAGASVLPKLVAKDRSYPDTFKRTMSGVAEKHSLTLDFGVTAKGNKSILVLSGWVDWADGSTFLGLSQQGKGLSPPELQVRDAGGKWKTVIADMGMPAGKPKTIVVDLTGKFLSNSREVRILTNLCVYWDEIYLSEQTTTPEATLTSLPVRASDLRFRGFSPSRIHPERKQPEAFDYEGATPTSLWNPTPGLYTRYGDVGELVKAADDRMIVMGSGDEIRLRYSTRSLPALKPGWRRDFLLKVDGWAKDRDANTAHSQTTEPLPFHKMSKFPYPSNERYPDDAVHQRYRDTYNTRPALRLLRPLVGE